MDLHKEKRSLDVKLKAKSNHHTHTNVFNGGSEKKKTDRENKPMDSLTEKHKPDIYKKK